MRPSNATATSVANAASPMRWGHARTTRREILGGVGGDGHGDHGSGAAAVLSCVTPTGVATYVPVLPTRLHRDAAPGHPRAGARSAPTRRTPVHAGATHDASPWRFAPSARGACTSVQRFVDPNCSVTERLAAAHFVLAIHRHAGSAQRLQELDEGGAFGRVHAIAPGVAALSLAERSPVVGRAVGDPVVGVREDVDRFDEVGGSALLVFSFIEVHASPAGTGARDADARVVVGGEIIVGT